MSGRHLRQLAIASGVILATLLFVGVPAQTALTFAVLLACPLVVGAMLVMMLRESGRASEVGARPTEPSPRNCRAEAGRDDQ